MKVLGLFLLGEEEDVVGARLERDGPGARNGDEDITRRKEEVRGKMVGTGRMGTH
jgi:hypothetical protein